MSWVLGNLMCREESVYGEMCIHRSRRREKEVFGTFGKLNALCLSIYNTVYMYSIEFYNPKFGRFTSNLFPAVVVKCRKLCNEAIRFLTIIQFLGYVIRQVMSNWVKENEGLRILFIFCPFHFFF